jgi:Predicted RNA-binding protein
MGKGQDFYGKDIAEVIEQACKTLEASREELDIEVLETGSAGIFGLCKKKAHIRVQRKNLSLNREIDAVAAEMPAVPDTGVLAGQLTADASIAPATATAEDDSAGDSYSVEVPPAVSVATHTDPAQQAGDADQEGEQEALEEDTSVEPPTAGSLEAIQADLHQLLLLMRTPSDVRVEFENNTVYCTITGQHEAHIIGTEGRTLDSLQYLLRRMSARHLPDRVLLALNAGDFRERRTEELKLRAVDLAAQVKVDGRTQAIPALNPSERRVVHMMLQNDKEVRSRSVGEGLFKKVLIYKPGKGRRSVPGKRRGGQSGRSSGD